MLTTISTYVAAHIAAGFVSLGIAAIHAKVNDYTLKAEQSLGHVVLWPMHVLRKAWQFVAGGFKAMF